MTTYFISDIHLHAESTQNSKLLLDFLSNQGSHADAIYILGDLFAIWFGDDLAAPYAEKLASTLKELHAQNVPVYFMPGNRDFLVGKDFCRAAECTLLADPYVLKLYGKQVILTHGDALCTRDSKYQKFRNFVQHPNTKAFFLGLPKFLRIKIGNWVRRSTSRTSKIKYATIPEILDVDPEIANQWLEKLNADFMIHGHTHKPAIHKHGTATRIVLGDWNEKTAKILAFSPNGFELQDLLTS